MAAADPLLSVTIEETCHSTTKLTPARRSLRCDEVIGKPELLLNGKGYLCSTYCISFSVFSILLEQLNQNASSTCRHFTLSKCGHTFGRLPKSS